ncbi:MAG: mRNA interferase MazF [Neolewinella sp.]|jgi:mRNA interferase MazF
MISNDDSNKGGWRYQVVPLSTKTGKLYPSEILISFKGDVVKVLPSQLTTISKEGLRGRLGTLSPAALIAVEQAVANQLGLELAKEGE